MVKQKKKRNKKYSGADSAIKRPTVTKITAANRSAVSQWFFEKRQFLRPVLVVVGIAILIVIIVAGIISLF